MATHEVSDALDSDRRDQPVQEQDAVEGATEPAVESEPERTPDERLLIDLYNAFETFSHRQREIRRLGRYVRERGEEIDDAKDRARELIEQQLQKVDETALDALMDSFVKNIFDATEADGLSDEDRLEAVQSALDEASRTLPEGAASHYLGSIARVTVTPPAAPMLFRSLLISLVGEVETLFASVARALYVHDPEKLEQSTKTYTWSEISKFGSIEEFEEHVRERTIDRMLHGSFPDWIDDLRTRFHVPTPARSADYSVLEVFQRRHLMVHSGGVVSRQYLEKLEHFSIDEKLGDELDVDHEYLCQASDVLLVVALSLVAGATFRVTKEERVTIEMEGHIANTCFRLLQERRYEAVVDITRQLTISKIGTELYRHIIEVNGWLALKLLGRFDECAGAVRKFDVSARRNDLRLAKLALLDQVEEAHELAQTMIKNDELPQEHWLTWPLLADVRAYHERLTLGETEGADQP